MAAFDAAWCMGRKEIDEPTYRCLRYFLPLRLAFQLRLRSGHEHYASDASIGLANGATNLRLAALARTDRWSMTD